MLANNLDNKTNTINENFMIIRCGPNHHQDMFTFFLK